VRAKPQYGFLPKDWEERTVPFSAEVAEILRKHPHVPGCQLVFPSPKSHLNYRFLHERCKEIATRAGLNKDEWHLHRFRDTAATRWLRAGIDMRTVQVWLGSRVAGNNAEISGALKRHTETARQDEAAVLVMHSPLISAPMAPTTLSAESPYNTETASIHRSSRNALFARSFLNCILGKAERRIQ
jgi:integrase